MTNIVYTKGLSPDGGGAGSQPVVVGQSTWRINANGSLGTLTLQSTDNLRLNGSVRFDGDGREDQISGGWNDNAGQITFTRMLGNSTTTQTFIGFLGNNHPEQLLLAGTFTESDVPANAPRNSFAWFASSATLIV